MATSSRLQSTSVHILRSTLKPLPHAPLSHNNKYIYYRFVPFFNFFFFFFLIASLHILTFRPALSFILNGHNSFPIFSPYSADMKYEYLYSFKYSPSFSRLNKVLFLSLTKRNTADHNISFSLQLFHFEIHFLMCDQIFSNV